MSRHFQIFQLRFPKSFITFRLFIFFLSNFFLPFDLKNVNSIHSKSALFNYYYLVEDSSQIKDFFHKKSFSFVQFYNYNYPVK